MSDLTFLDGLIIGPQGPEGPQGPPGPSGGGGGGTVAGWVYNADVGNISGPWGSGYRQIDVPSTVFLSNGPFDPGLSAYIKFQYRGDEPVYVLATATFVVVGDNYGFDLRAGITAVADISGIGSPEPGEVLITTLNNTAKQTVSVQRLLEVEPNHYVALYMQCPGGTYGGSLTLGATSLSAILLPA